MATSSRSGSHWLPVVLCIASIGCVSPDKPVITASLAGDLSDFQKEALYADLQARVPHIGGDTQGIWRSRGRNGVVWVVCDGPCSGPGPGAIGVYDERFRRLDTLETQALEHASPIWMEGVGEAILAVDGAGGTGLRTSDLHLLNVDDLDHPLWTCEYVDHWSYAPLGYDTELTHHVVLLGDLDWDGTAEILVLEIAFRKPCDPEEEEASTQALVLSRPQLKAAVYRFDRGRRQFRRQYEFVVRPELEGNYHVLSGLRQSHPQILRALDLSPDRQIIDTGRSTADGADPSLSSSDSAGFWIEGIGQVWDAAAVKPAKRARWQVTHTFHAADRPVWSFADRYGSEAQKDLALRHVILFIDLDWDGIQEILDVEARIDEVPREWAVRCHVLRYDEGKKVYGKWYDVQTLGASADSKRTQSPCQSRLPLRLLWPQPSLSAE